MLLAPGTRLGPYEIAARIGAGGMGEVWRATDVNLKRVVAIKVLPDTFMIDAERLARFRREAEVLASLNHPNVAAVYGLENADGIRALVMEFVEGLTLADRVVQGPIPVDETLPIARQIADALEAAHDQGIIHRDLKPANIKVRADGTVKVLDFGLAKAMDPAGAATSGVSMSPTITTPAMTQAGIILGTAAYMSPEQAKGKAADTRSDVWAFGCVLFELLTGRRAFAGEDVSDTLAAVLRADPDWSALPNDVPSPIRRLLRRCLQKDRRERLADIADARLEIHDALRNSPEEVAHGASTARAPRGHLVLTAALAGTVLVAVSIVVWTMRTGRPAEPAELVQLQLLPAGDVTIAPGTNPEVSPDGRAIAFAGFGGDGISRVFVRALDSPEVRPLAGSERVRNNLTPFWSPDSREVAFEVGGTLKRVAVAGGPPQNVCDLPRGLTVIGGAWSLDAALFVGTYAGLMRGRASGGACEFVTRASPSDANHFFPVLLPDGRHFLYLRNGLGDLVAGSLDAAPDTAPKSLMKIRQGVDYVPAPGSPAGRLLFVRDSTLFAQPFDPERLEFAGDAVPLAGNIGTSYASAHFSASTNGRLAYRTADSNSVQLTWFDRQGRPVAEVGEPVFPSALSVSPDGRRVAYGSLVPPYGLMSMDLPRGTNSRLTDVSTDTGVAWSADGERIVFAGRDGVQQRVLNAAAAQQMLLPSAGQGLMAVWDWSRDGRFILYTMLNSETRGRELSALPLDGDRKPLAMRTAGSEARFSPDGRWFAYVSDESGRNEVYIRAFEPASMSRSSEAGTPYTIVSKGNVTGMLGWRDDGRELWYVTPDSAVMSVALRFDRMVEAGEPMQLFQLRPGVRMGQAAAGVLSTDGERFLIGVPTRRSTQVPFTVVLNWPALMRN